MTNLRRPEVTDLVEIGRGGFGVVYRARQEQFRRDVAVKVISAKLDVRARARFTQECRALGQLSGHPHIVTVYDGGIDPDERGYLIMPLFARGSLAQRIRTSGPLPWQEAVDIGVRLAGALQTAHEAGILHRDLKPGNVLIDEYGAPRLADFGQARFVDADLTRSGDITATPAFAAPEVIQGQPATPGADVYSLAATVMALIIGRPPFDGAEDGSVAVLYRVLSERPPDLRQRGVPDSAAAVLEAAMAKEPAHRPDSAMSFGVALQRAQQSVGLPVTPLAVAGQPLLLPPGADGGPTQLSRSAAPAPPGRFGTVPYGREQPPGAPPYVPAPAQRPPAAAPVGRRRRWGVLAVAAILVVALVVAGLFAVQALNEPAPRENLVARDLILPPNALGDGWELNTEADSGTLDDLLDGDYGLLECLRLPGVAEGEENAGALQARDLQTSAVYVDPDAMAVAQTAGIVTGSAASPAEVVDGLRSPGFDLCLSEAENLAQGLLSGISRDFDRELSYPEPPLPELPAVVDGSARRIVVPVADDDLDVDSAVLDYVFLAAGDAVAAVGFLRFGEPVDSAVRDAVLLELVDGLTE